MSIIHKCTIDKLKTEFHQILQTYDEIHLQQTSVHEQLVQLKEIYNTLIKNNNKKIFLFCLDSFYFQYKVLNIEMENLTKYISLINNRMYGDYYKLYNIILMQTSQLNIDITALLSDSKKYATYKDLEPFKEYPMQDIQGLHLDILNVITQLYSHYSTKEDNITEYSERTHIGISISNFIDTLEYENTLIREQIGLYFNYIGFFHKSHKTFLAKLLVKVRQFKRDIEEDITMNGSGSGNGSVNGSGSVNVQVNASKTKIKRESNERNIDSFFTLAKFEETELTIKLSPLEQVLNESDKIVNQSENMLKNIENIILVESVPIVVAELESGSSQIDNSVNQSIDQNIES